MGRACRSGSVTGARARTRSRGPAWCGRRGARHPIAPGRAREEGPTRSLGSDFQGRHSCPRSPPDPASCPRKEGKDASRRYAPHSSCPSCPLRPSTARLRGLWDQSRRSFSRLSCTCYESTGRLSVLVQLRSRDVL